METHSTRPWRFALIVAAATAVAALDLPLAAPPVPADDLPRAAAAGDPPRAVADGQLAALVRELRERNPQLLAARTVGRSRRERVPQARALPDLQVRYRYFAEAPETRVGPQEQQLEVSQGIPWRGKRGLQAEREEHLAASADWQARDLESALIAELKRAYFEAAYLAEAITLVAEEHDLLHRFEAIALRRYATGQGIQQNVIKVQTDITRLEDRETGLRERRDVLLRQIAELVGRPDEELNLAPVALVLPETSRDWGALEERALSGHPQVRALEREIEAAHAWSRRRALESRPDFRFGLGYTLVDDREDRAGVLMPPQDNGQDVLALTFGIDIPLQRDRIRAGVAEAEESGRRSAEMLQAARDRLRRALQQAILRLESAGERARLYDEVLIPQAEESLASAEAAYTTNRQGFLDLLDAERVLFEVRRTHWRLVSDCWIALADLERAIGEEIA